MFKNFLFSLGIFCIYVFLSFLYFGSNLSWSTNYIGQGSDPIQFMWFLNWWPFAVEHQLNPFITHYVWFPSGFDLAWATSIPTLAALTSPLTMTMGSVFSFNFLSLIAAPLSAISAYLLIQTLGHALIKLFPFCLGCDSNSVEVFDDDSAL